MPYYQWRGVDIVATIHKGSLFAQSPEHLAQVLAKKDIYLLNAHVIKPRFSLKPITQSDRTAFFRQLATLLEAKVMLPQALALVSEQTDNQRLQAIIFAVTDQVYSGKALHTALREYPHLFSPLTVQLLEVGQETGTMSASCNTIATYAEQQVTLQNKIRSALVLPAVTFICFIGITLVIFIALIPRFATTFAALKVPLPQSTQTLLYISSCITATSVAGACFFITFIALLFYRLSKNNRCTAILARLFLHFPFFGPLSHKRFCASLFQSLSILTDHTVSLNDALTLLAQSEKNNSFRQELIALEKATTAGAPLSAALSRSTLNLFSQSVIAMIAIGEESNNLGFMFTKVKEQYLNAIQKNIHTLTTLIQPALMLILGLCIALLITALYIPLFNLSLYVGQ